MTGFQSFFHFDENNLQSFYKQYILSYIKIRRYNERWKGCNMNVKL